MTITDIIKMTSLKDKIISSISAISILFIIVVMIIELRAVLTMSKAANKFLKNKQIEHLKTHGDCGCNSGNDWLAKQEIELAEKTPTINFYSKEIEIQPLFVPDSSSFNASTRTRFKVLGKKNNGSAIVALHQFKNVLGDTNGQLWWEVNYTSDGSRGQYQYPAGTDAMLKDIEERLV